MKANTVAAAAVLWRPDKTMPQVLKKKQPQKPQQLILCSLYFFVSKFSPVSPYLSANDPSSFSRAVNVSTLQSGPRPNSVAEPLCLR